MKPRPESAAARRALTRGMRHELPRGVVVLDLIVHYRHNYRDCPGDVDVERTINASGAMTIRLRCTGCGLVEIFGTDG